MNWIRDFVDLDGLDLDKLIRRFTLATAEVEDIYHKGEDLQNVVVGRIVSVENHPDSKKLHLLKVDVGAEVVDIVCGAPNVREGMLVPTALAGGRVPAGEIKVAKVAGYESHGMCCAGDELGISDDHSGLLEITEDAAPGTDICDLWPIRDTVFEVDNKSLTNRPDLWGHYGIAREFATITGRDLRPLDIDDADYTEGEPVPVEIKSDLVYRYSALRINNIKKNVSPMAMRIRLYYCGMRGINLLADLTNYIMLEMGQPMHAFDGSKVQSIAVGTPAEKGSFTTLDSQEREVDEDTLLIYNNDEPVAIAGVMGGLDSEIVGETDSVVLESANFSGVSVRKTGARLGLRTDASMRYEKILDPEMTVPAIRRFVKLLRSVDSGAVVASPITDAYPIKYPEITISFNKAYVDRYTGIEITNDTIIDTLTRLGFGVGADGDDFTVKVPSWRATKDVTIKADIIEEITRIYGYDNFKIITTRSPLKPVRPEPVKSEDARIKDLLVRKFNLHEVQSYIWCDGKKFKKLGIEVEPNCRILNIPTPENGTIRNSMIPTLLTVASENKGYAPSYGIFECGRVVDGFKKSDRGAEDAPDVLAADDTKRMDPTLGDCNERRHLGVVLFSRTENEKELYYSVVNMIKFLFSDIKHAQPVAEKTAPKHAWQHPKNTAALSMDGVRIGEIFTLHPAVRQKLDKNAAVVCAELDLDAFYALPVCDKKFEEPSKFPGVDYDLSLVINETQKYADIKTAWEALAIPELRGAEVIDVFDLGKSRSLTVRLSFSSNDRTLKMEEIQSDIDRILENLAGQGIVLKT